MVLDGFTRHSQSYRGLRLNLGFIASLQQQESPTRIEETPPEPAVKYEVLDVVEEDMDESNAVRDPGRAELEPTISVTSQSSSEGGGFAEPSSEGSLTSTPPSGSQSEGPPPAKPLTPRTSERKRKATGNDSELTFTTHPELSSLSEKIRQSKLQKGKEDLEAELRRLDSKSEGLRAQIDGNGLTVATRVRTFILI